MLRHLALAAAAVAAVALGATTTGTSPGPAAATTGQPGLQTLLDGSGIDLPFDPQLAAVSCPVERGPVKEGSDATRFKVSTTVLATTVAHLRALAKPGSYPKATRIAPNEDRTWQIKTRLTQFKLEADGDIHLVVVDSSGRKMIAEIPYGACVPSSSRWKSAIASARHTFTTTYHVTTTWHHVSRTIVLRGLGFFDVPHGQTGAAPNGIELHPVIYLRFA